MTEIERKALALVNEQFAGSTFEYHDIDDADVGDMQWALSLAIERHEQFAQEVSDALGERGFFGDRILGRFIITKPDHIRAAALDIGISWGSNDSDSFRAALAARGLEITEKKQ